MEFNSFWDTNTMHAQALFMVMEKNMLWFCSFFFSLFFSFFPEYPLKLKMDYAMGPMDKRKIHTLRLCISPNEQKHLRSQLSAPALVQ